MPSDPERRKRIRSDVEWLRGQQIDLDDGSPRWPFDSLAELVAYQAERARAESLDEAEIAEVVLTASSTCREDLLEADAVLRPLGYTAISAVLRRLARRAPPRSLTRWQQWKNAGRAVAPYRLTGGAERISR
jgi:hypothetical protein